MITMKALVNKSPPSAVSTVDVETLRQQLQHQESTIHELRVLVQKLTRENSQLKSHVDSKEYEVQL